MANDANRRARKPDKIKHLDQQVERARKMAAECGSPLVADLLEVHAQICERNAKARMSRKRKLSLV
jgi:hypothetical protein